MKSLKIFLPIVALMLAFASCTKDDVSVQDDIPDVTPETTETFELNFRNSVINVSDPHITAREETIPDIPVPLFVRQLELAYAGFPAISPKITISYGDDDVLIAEGDFSGTSGVSMEEELSQAFQEWLDNGADPAETPDMTGDVFEEYDASNATVTISNLASDESSADVSVTGYLIDEDGVQYDISGEFPGTPIN